MDQTWRLSQIWYRERLMPEYHGRTAEQAQQIFRDLDLTSPFWYL